MNKVAREAIRVVLLDADEQFRTLMAHHITTAWPQAEIMSLASLTELDDSAMPHCFVLDHETLQQAANSPDSSVWFRAAAVVARSPCIIVADPSDELLAVRYMKAGARDFLPKRLLKHDLIVASISECLEASPSAGAAHAEAADLTPTPAPTPAPQRQTANATSAREVRRRDAGGSGSSNSSKVAAAAEEVRGAPVIAGYRIIRPIAKGGAGSVWLAHSEALGHDVALKLLQVGMSNAANRLYERFEQEYRLTSTIDSLSVVKPHDYGRSDKEVYIAFEYFPRGDLRTRMRKHLSVDESVEYMCKIALALRELHAHAILHRDLKPANVMLRADDSIALIDFGMAKHLKSSEQLTLPGTIHGTPNYLSPEQAAGRTVDERSDIYSLGVLFFEMLEGCKPYAAKTALEICLAHIKDPVPKLSPEHSRYQPILDWMMAKEISQRCPDVGALLDMLQSKGASTSRAS